MIPQSARCARRARHRCADRLLVALTLAATAGFADPSRAAEPRLQAVLSAATLSFRDDGNFDRALLVASGDDGADLYIYLASADDRTTPSTLALEKKGLVWSGGMWGTLPSLAVSGHGSLLVKAQNDAVGRERWELTLTIVRRNDQFLVAGVTYSSRDTLRPGAEHRCDINLLTGTAARDGHSTRGAPRMLRVSDWSDEAMPKECRF